jgi:hypothetical protein
MVPVKCTLVSEETPSGQVELTVAVPAMVPEQLSVPVIPEGVKAMFDIWQEPVVCGGGPPYLSIMAWVTQTWVVLGALPKGDPAGSCTPAGNGDC